MTISSVLRPFIPPASFALAGLGLSASPLASLAQKEVRETAAECIQCAISFLHLLAALHPLLHGSFALKLLHSGGRAGLPSLPISFAGCGALVNSPVVRLTAICICQSFCIAGPLTWPGAFILAPAAASACGAGAFAACLDSDLSRTPGLPLWHRSAFHLAFVRLLGGGALLCRFTAQVPVLLFMHTDSSEEDIRIADLTACRWPLPSSSEQEQVASPAESEPYADAHGVVDPPVRYIEVNVCIGERSICYFDITSGHTIQDLLDASEDPGCASSTTCYRVTRITVRTAAITLGCAERPPDYITPPSSDSEA